MWLIFENEPQDDAYVAILSDEDMQRLAEMQKRALEILEANQDINHITFKFPRLTVVDGRFIENDNLYENGYVQVEDFPHMDQTVKTTVAEAVFMRGKVVNTFLNGTMVYDDFDFNMWFPIENSILEGEKC